jgi:hypothetical protein
MRNVNADLELALVALAGADLDAESDVLRDVAAPLRRRTDLRLTNTLRASARDIVASKSSRKAWIRGVVRVASR